MTCERALAIINPFSKVKMSSSSDCRLPRSLCRDNNAFMAVVRIPSSLCPRQPALWGLHPAMSYWLQVGVLLPAQSQMSGLVAEPSGRDSLMVIHSREWHFANSIFFCHTYTFSERSHNTWANLLFLRFLAPLRWANSQNFLPKLCFLNHRDLSSFFCMYF